MISNKRMQNNFKNMKNKNWNEYFMYYKIIAVQEAGIATVTSEAGVSNGVIHSFSMTSEKGLIQNSINGFLNMYNRLRANYMPLNMRDKFLTMKIRSQQDDMTIRFNNHIKNMDKIADFIEELSQASTPEKRLEIFKQAWLDAGSQELTGLLRLANIPEAQGVNEGTEREKIWIDKVNKQSVEKQIEKIVSMYKKFGKDFIKLAIASHDVFKSVDDINHVLYSTKALLEAPRVFTKKDFEKLFVTEESNSFWEKLQNFAEFKTDEGIVIDQEKLEGLKSMISKEFSNQQAVALEGILNKRSLLDRYTGIAGFDKDILLATIWIHQVQGASFTNTSYSQLINFALVNDINLIETQQLMRAALSRILADSQKTELFLDFLHVLTIIDAGAATEQGFVSENMLGNLDEAREKIKNIFELVFDSIPKNTNQDNRPLQIERQALTAHNLFNIIRQSMRKKEGVDRIAYLEMLRNMMCMYVKNIDDENLKHKIISYFEEAVKAIGQDKVDDLIDHAALILDQLYINTHSAALVALAKGTKLVQDNDGSKVDLAKLDISDKVDLASVTAVLKYNLLFARYCKLVQEEDKTGLLTFASSPHNIDFFTVDEVNSLWEMPDEKFVASMEEAMKIKGIEVTTTSFSNSETSGVYKTDAFSQSLNAMGMPGVGTIGNEEAQKAFQGEHQLAASARIIAGIEELKNEELKNVKKKILDNQTSDMSLGKSLDEYVKIRSILDHSKATTKNLNISDEKLQTWSTFYESVHLDKFFTVDKVLALIKSLKLNNIDAQGLWNVLHTQDIIDNRGIVISTDLSKVNWTDLSVNEKTIDKLKIGLTGLLKDAKASAKIIETVNYRISLDTPNYRPKIKYSSFENLCKTYITMKMLFTALTWANFLLAVGGVGLFGPVTAFIFAGAMTYFTMMDYAYTTNSLIDATRKWEPLLGPDADRDLANKPGAIEGHNMLPGQASRNRRGFSLRQLYHGPLSKANFQAGSPDGYSFSNLRSAFNHHKEVTMGEVINRLIRKEVFGLDPDTHYSKFGPKRDNPGDSWQIRNLALNLVMEPTGESSNEILVQSIQEPLYGFDPSNESERAKYMAFLNNFAGEHQYRQGTKVTHMALSSILKELKENLSSDKAEAKKQLRLIQIVESRMRSIIEAGQLKDFVRNDTFKGLLETALADTKVKDEDIKWLAQIINEKKDAHILQVFEELGSKAYFKYYSWMPNTFYEGLDAITSRAIGRDFIERCRADIGGENIIAELGMKLLSGMELKEDENRNLLETMVRTYHVTAEQAKEIIDIVKDKATEISTMANQISDIALPNSPEAREIRWQLEDDASDKLLLDNLSLSRLLVRWEKKRDEIKSRGEKNSPSAITSKEKLLESLLADKFLAAKMAQYNLDKVPLLDEAALKKIIDANCSDIIDSAGIDKVLQEIEKILILALPTKGALSNPSKYKESNKLLENRDQLFIPIKLMEGTESMIQGADPEGYGGRLFIETGTTGTYQGKKLLETFISQNAANVSNLKFLTNFTNQKLTAAISKTIVNMTLTAEEKKIIYSGDTVYGIKVEDAKKLTYEQFERQLNLQYEEKVNEAVQKTIKEFIQELQKLGETDSEGNRIGLSKKKLSEFFPDEIINGIAARLAGIVVEEYIHEHYYRTNAMAYGYLQETMANKNTLESLKEVLPEAMKPLMGDNKFSEAEKEIENTKKDLHALLQKEGTVATGVTSAGAKDFNKALSTFIEAIDATVGYAISNEKDNQFHSAGYFMSYNDASELLMDLLFEDENNLKIKIGSQESIYKDKVIGVAIEKVFEKKLKDLENDIEELKQKSKSKLTKKEHKTLRELNELERLSKDEKYLKDFENDINELKIKSKLTEEEYQTLKELNEKLDRLPKDEKAKKDLEKDINKLKKKSELNETEYQTLKELNKKLDRRPKDEKKLKDLENDIEKLKQKSNLTEEEYQTLKELNEKLDRLPKDKKYLRNLDLVKALHNFKQKALKTPEGTKNFYELKLALSKHIDAVGLKARLKQRLMVMIQNLRLDVNDPYQGRVSAELAVDGLLNGMYKYLSKYEGSINEETIDDMCKKLIENRVKMLESSYSFGGFSAAAKPYIHAFIGNSAKELEKIFTWMDKGHFSVKTTDEENQKRVINIRDWAKKLNFMRIDMFQVQDSMFDSKGSKGGIWSNIVLGSQHHAQVGNLLRKTTEQTVLEKTGRYFIDPEAQQVLGELVVKVINFAGKDSKIKRSLGITSENIYYHLLNQIVIGKRDVKKVVDELVDSWNLDEKARIYPGTKKEKTAEDIKAVLTDVAREMIIKNYSLQHLRGTAIALQQIFFKARNGVNYKLEGTNKEGFAEAKSIFESSTNVNLNKLLEKEEKGEKVDWPQFDWKTFEEGMKKHFKDKLKVAWNHIANDAYVVDQIGFQLKNTLENIKEDIDKINIYNIENKYMRIAQGLVANFLHQVSNGKSQIVQGDSAYEERINEIKKQLGEDNLTIGGIVDAIKKELESDLKKDPSIYPNKIIFEETVLKFLNDFEHTLIGLQADFMVKQRAVLTAVLTLQTKIEPEEILSKGHYVVGVIAAYLFQNGIIDMQGNSNPEKISEEVLNEVKKIIDNVMKESSNDEPLIGFSIEKMREAIEKESEDSKRIEYFTNVMNPKEHGDKLLGDLILKDSKVIQDLFNRFNEQSIKSSHLLNSLNYTANIGGVWVKGTWYTQNSRQENFNTKTSSKANIEHYQKGIKEKLFGQREKKAGQIKLRDWAVFDRARTMEEVTEWLASNRADEIEEHRLPEHKYFKGQNEPYLKYLIDAARVVDSGGLLDNLDNSMKLRELQGNVERILGQVSVSDVLSKKYDPISQNYAAVAIAQPNIFDDLATQVVVEDEFGNEAIYLAQTKMIGSLDGDNEPFKNKGRIINRLSYNPETLQLENQEYIGVQVGQGQLDRTSSDKINLNTAFLTTQLTFNNDRSGEPEATTARAFPCGCYNMITHNIQEISFYQRYLEDQDIRMDWGYTKIMTRFLVTKADKGWIEATKQLLNKEERAKWLNSVYFTSKEQSTAFAVVKGLHMSSIAMRVAIPLAMIMTTMTSSPILLALSLALGLSTIMSAKIRDNSWAETFKAFTPLGLGLTGALLLNPAFAIAVPMAFTLYSVTHKMIEATSTKENGFSEWDKHEAWSYIATGISASLVNMAIMYATGGTSVGLNATIPVTAMAMLMRKLIFSYNKELAKEDNPAYFAKIDKPKTAHMYNFGRTQYERRAFEGMVYQSYVKALEDSASREDLIRRRKLLEWSSYLIGTNPIDNSLMVKIYQFAGRWIPKSVADGHFRAMWEYARMASFDTIHKTTSMMSYPFMFYIKTMMPIFLVSYLLFGVSSIQFGAPNVSHDLMGLSVNFSMFFGLFGIMSMMLGDYTRNRRMMDGGLPKEQAKYETGLQSIFHQQMIEQVSKALFEKFQIFNKTNDADAPVTELKAQSIRDYSYLLFNKQKEMAYVRKNMFMYSLLATVAISTAVAGVMTAAPIGAVSVGMLLSFFALYELSKFDKAHQISYAGADAQTFVKNKEHNSRLQGIFGVRRMLFGIMAIAGAIEGTYLASNYFGLQDNVMRIFQDSGLLYLQTVVMSFLQDIGLLSLKTSVGSLAAAIVEFLVAAVTANVSYALTMRWFDNMGKFKKDKAPLGIDTTSMSRMNTFYKKINNDKEKIGITTSKISQESRPEIFKREQELTEKLAKYNFSQEEILELFSIRMQLGDYRNATIALQKGFEFFTKDKVIREEYYQKVRELINNVSNDKTSTILLLEQLLLNNGISEIELVRLYNEYKSMADIKGSYLNSAKEVLEQGLVLMPKSEVLKRLKEDDYGHDEK